METKLDLKGENMTHKQSSLSRRDFLRLSAVSLGTLAGGRLLSACGQAPTPGAMATPSPAATETAAATALPSATATQAATATASITASRSSLPEIMKFFPTVPSKVIHTHHSGVWSDKTLVPGALRQMLDASITKLTGLNDAREGWAALFKPGERIAIKVNTFRNSRIWTHSPLVLEVTNSLQAAGIPAEQITIFDYQSSELETAGYALNADNPGVRCIGMDRNFSPEPTNVLKNQVKLANILKECDALINIPILKSHMMAGITFAMKNHYGSIYYPDVLHGDNMRSVAALNALPEINDRTRLIIGDALSANLRYTNSYPYWKEDWIGDSIFMSYDPVAHDTMGLDLLTRELEKDGGDPAYLVGLATPSMQYAVELGLGTNDPANMQVLEQSLS
jgi:hypothetical protein